MLIMDDAEPFDWTPEIDLVKSLLLPERVPGSPGVYGRLQESRVGAKQDVRADRY